MSREYKPIVTPVGSELTCKSWVTEGLMRTFMNMFNAEIASDPKNLIIYKDFVQAVRNWDTFDEIINELKILEADETLVIQSGKPVGIFQTHLMAPRVLITNSMILNNRNYAEILPELRNAGLTFFSDSTVGSWSFIGSQGLIGFYYLLFKQIARRYFKNRLTGKIILSTGLKTTQGFDASAAHAQGAIFLTSEEDSDLVENLVQKGVIHHKFNQVDVAINKAFELKTLKTPETVAFVGKASDLVKAITTKNLVPAIVTDNSKVSQSLDIASINSIKQQTEFMLKLKNKGSIVFDSGNGIRQIARGAGFKNAMTIPGCYELFIRDLFSEGKGALQWTALSGDDEDIKRIDDLILEAYPDNEYVTSWINHVQQMEKFPGLPSRICWLGHGEKRYIASEINRLVRDEELAAPVVISRESIDAGSAVNPGCITENMHDKSDSIADWVFLNAMLNASSGASLVSLQQAQNTCGNTINTGISLVANGSPETDKRISMVFANDHGIGIMRYADAGYGKAIHAAMKYGLMAIKNQSSEKKTP